MIAASLYSLMTVTLEGAKEGCTISWGFTTNFTKGESFKTLDIQVTVPCSLSGGAEIYYVTFKKPKVIQDTSNNALATETLHAYAKRFVYVDDSQQAAVSGTGSTFTASGFATLGLVVGINLFQSMTVGSFWTFMDMLQIISYLPLLALNFPYNLEVFLTEYLTVSEITIPFKMLPSWVPNPITYVKSFAGNMVGGRFLDCGYESFSFIYNMSENLFTWVFLLIFYVLLRILTRYIPKKKYCCMCNIGIGAE